VECLNLLIELDGEQAVFWLSDHTKVVAQKRGKSRDTIGVVNAIAETPCGFSATISKQGIPFLADVIGVKYTEKD
jgi:hypothetical protein